MKISCGALGCENDPFLSSILKCIGTLTAAWNWCPSFRFSLSLQSTVENYFQLNLSGSIDVWSVFHQLFIISFPILSWFTLKIWLSGWYVWLLLLLWVDLRGWFLFPSITPSAPNMLTCVCSYQCLFDCCFIFKNGFYKQSLHVLPVYAWVVSGYSGFLHSECGCLSRLSLCGPVMDWRPVQGVPCLSSDDHWDRLQPPHDLTDGLSGYRRWMDFINS